MLESHRHLTHLTTPPRPGPCRSRRPSHPPHIGLRAHVCSDDGEAGAEAAEKAPSKPASDCELETEVESEEEDEVEGGKAVNFKPNKQEVR